MGFDPTTKHKTTTTVLGPIGSGYDYILIRDIKSSGSDGGSFASGAFRTRDLNEITQDDTGNVTLSSNQFTLPAGTYEIQAVPPCNLVIRNRARLQNITDATTTLVSKNGFAAESSGNRTSPGQNAEIQGKFTITSPKAFEIQHQCETTVNGFGFGVDSTIASLDEVYTVVELRKVA